MDTNLLKIRAISFFYGFASLVGLAIVGVLVSPEFVALIKAHFGSGIFTSLLLLLVPELVKHLRNLSTIKKLGAKEGKYFLV